MTDTVARAAEAWGAFFGSIDPAQLGRLPTLVTSDVRFRDPFHDTVGPDALARVFHHMHAMLRAPRFHILDQARSGDTIYFRWRFEATTRRGSAIAVDGMSEVRFTPDGLVASHFDHWDAASQLYARLPIIGAPMRWLNRRAAARP